jgi:hypothetical protein
MGPSADMQAPTCLGSWEGVWEWIVQADASSESRKEGAFCLNHLQDALAGKRFQELTWEGHGLEFQA